MRISVLAALAFALTAGEAPGQGAMRGVESTDLDAARNLGRAIRR